MKKKVSIYMVKDADQFTNEELLFYFMKDGKGMGLYAKSKFLFHIQSRGLFETFCKLCFILKKDPYEIIQFCQHS